MSQYKNSGLKANLIYNTIYQILLIIVPLITAPYISRVLGTSGVGEYGYTYSIAHYFALFAILGISTYGNREIASVRGDKEKITKTFWEIFSVQLTTGSISFICYILFLLIFDVKYKLIFAMQGLYLFSAVIDISWFFFGIEKFKTTATISTINKIATTALVFLLVKRREDVFIYTLIVAGGVLINHIVYVVLLPKYTSKGRYSLEAFKARIKPILILFIPVVAISLYKYMDKIMLGAMLDTSEVGIYESAEKFINLPLGVITAFGTVMLPRITNMKANKDESNVSRYNFVSMIFIMFLSFGIAFGLAGVTNVFIPWFYGEDFRRSSDVLLILLPSVLFISWANVIRTQCLLPNKKDIEYCASVILGAIVNLVINWLLIPTMGASGAAIGTTIAELTVCVIQCIATRKLLDFRRYIKYCIPLAGAAVIMYFIIGFVKFESDFLTVVFRIIIGATVYCVLALPVLQRTIKRFKQT